MRWTENRNLQAFLALVASGAVHPERLEAETVAFEDSEGVYEELAGGERRTLSVVFRYAADASAARTLPLAPPRRAPSGEEVGVAFLGAGNYAKGVLLPALARCREARPRTLVTATGASARRTAERFGFTSCGTEPTAVFDDPAVDLVFVATRHDSHAELASAALRRGKAVWLEKPVGLTPEQVEEVVEAARESGSFLTVGYNRRFSAHTRALRGAFAKREGPIAIHYAVAAGPPPAGSWITDPEVGGGRILGEVCHFVDLCTHLVGKPPATVYARALGRDLERDDSIVATLGYPDGSVASIEYLSRSDPGLPKERIEISGDGCTARSENFRVTTLGGGKTLKTLNQDKGQEASVAATLAAVRSGADSPIPLDEIAGVSAATFSIRRSLETC